MKLFDPALLRSQAHVGGAWIDADAGATCAVRDPATGEEIARVPRLGAAETRRAVEAATAREPDADRPRANRTYRRWGVTP